MNKMVFSKAEVQSRKYIAKRCDISIIQLLYVGVNVLSKLTIYCKRGINIRGFGDKTHVRRFFYSLILHVCYLKMYNKTISRCSYFLG
jgi:hypothetical protein